MVWPLPLLALASVVDVVDNPNSVSSFLDEYECFNVLSVGIPYLASVIDITGNKSCLRS